jgi:hypothetical protein
VRQARRHVHGHLDTAAARERQRCRSPAHERSAACARIQQTAFARFCIGTRDGRVIELQFVGEIAQTRQPVARAQSSARQVFFD